jgi:2-amino-4-hydroxy-6-hydroxymethyldihydropteridine diphosphokinase
MAVTYLGLGTNLGNREQNLLQAVLQVRSSCRLIAYSSIYVTAPIGYTNQADFLNMVIEVDSSSYTPEELLVLLKKIEDKIGRKRTFRWGPRIIDIDILYMEGVHLETEKLTIPHSEMFNRLFVLVPLLELTDSLYIDNRPVDLKDRINELTGGKENFPKRMVALFKPKSEIAING